MSRSRCRAAVESVAAVAALRLPAPLLYRLAAGKRSVIEGTALDLQTQALLGLIELERFPALNELSVAEAREAYGARGVALAGPVRAMEKTIDRTILGSGGRVPIRAYMPCTAPTKEPALVYYHGGGWVIGDLETHDSLCRNLAAEAGCVVVAVDYRRAPENKFPAAVEDAVAAYRWVLDHAGELGCDESRVAVGGDSAGGNLAAVVSVLARDTGWRIPVGQVLIYPVTDLRMSSRSHESFATGFLLTNDLMRWFRDCYLRTEADRLDPRASPLLTESLRNLPAAIITTAGFDPLRDEGRQYAERLRKSGVPVTYRCYDTMIHGFAGFTAGISAARLAVSETAASLRRLFAANESLSV